MTNISIIKHSSLFELKNNIRENLPLYENGEITTHVVPPAFKLHETRIPMVEMGEEISLPKSADSNYDMQNCLFISQLYGNLSPMQAADERMWAYATHITFFDYVQKRWPIPTEQKPKESEGDFTKRKIQHIAAHYFGKGNREIIRDNAISRLWWMGYIAKTCSEHSRDLPPQPNRTFTQERILEILLKKSDVRANILERPNLNMSKEIFNQIISLLDDDFNQKKEENTLFGRSNFRNFMKQLNRIGGMKVLNALPANSLAKLVREVREQVITASG